MEGVAAGAGAAVGEEGKRKRGGLLEGLLRSKGKGGKDGKGGGARGDAMG